MSESSGEARALRRMVEELRAAPPPELAWDAVESRLLAQIERAEVSRARRAAVQPSPFLRAASFAAAAAVLALGIGSVARTQASAPAPASVAASVEVDGNAFPVVAGGTDLAVDALRVGDVIDTGGESVTFSLPGSVRWTLAPASRAVVRAVAGGAGTGHVLALERGAIGAEVVPRPASEGLVEAFAVEVGQTRIAVHGTAFRVMKLDDDVLVEVEHGAVAVGPVGNPGSTTGHLLIGPARARFSLDGGRTAALLPAIVAAAPAVGAVVPAETHPVRIDEPSARVSPVRPGGLPDVRSPSSPTALAVVEAPAPVASSVAAPSLPAPEFLTAAAVRASLVRCFEQVRDPGGASLTTSVSSSFRMRLRGDGTIAAARFDPPLKPELQACAAGLLAGSFADGSVGEVIVSISIGR